MSNTITAAYSRRMVNHWSDDVQIGIWDREWSIRLYEDRAICRMPYAKWLRNSGSLSYRETRVTGHALQQLLSLRQQEIADEADYSHDAWQIAFGGLWH